ncbi:LUC7-domain-containing protein [Neoconidiobolus thromboides FSU 785]|nr:LUC7-domain-containing protein [Neoconidiobolus thromboides FSU 785]
MDYARSLLEELMNPYEQSLQRKLTDPDICPKYIAGYCPNDLFVNTKADLGPCSKVHDDRLKKEYEAEKDKSKYDFESIFLRTVSNLVEEVDRKVRRAKEKVDASIDEESLESKKAEVEEKIVIIDEKIKGLLALAETAGEEGRISEAKSYSSQVEALEAELERLKKSFEPDALEATNKPMEVCDVCAAYLVAGNEPKRTDAHVSGKMHTGYLRLRETYNEKIVSLTMFNSS